MKVRAHMTIDAEVLKKAKENARLEHRPLSQYVNLVLREHLEKKSQAQLEESNASAQN